MHQKTQVDMAVKPAASLRWAQAALTLILFVSLLAPTILCAIPGAPLSADEHECCKYMKERCGDPSMSSCCAIVPNTALNAPLTDKASLPEYDVQHAVVTYADIVVATPIAIPIDGEEVSSSPPPFPASSSIRVLRI